MLNKNCGTKIARQKGDYELADKIRDELEEKNYFNGY